MSARQRARPAAARGLTLIEIMLVLCLLVLLGAMSWPLLSKAFDGQRLRAAADLVRARLIRSRIEAIDSGATHQFRYAFDGRQFKISRQCANDAIDLPADEGDPLGAPTRSNDWQSGELPEGVTFVAGELPEGSSGDAAPLDSESSEWSAPIYFQPDGTASSATVRIRNENGRAMDIMLRGLTGVVTVSDVFAEEDGR